MIRQTRRRGLQLAFNPLFLTALIVKAVFVSSFLLPNNDFGPNRIIQASFQNNDRSFSLFASTANEEEEGSSSVDDIQKKLVRYGLAWTQSSASPSTTNDSPEDNLTRVPGCVATVYVSASIDGDTNKVSLKGHSDAIISRGLLALLSEFLGQLSPERVLELDKETIADELGVRSALSRGRNDGLANMLQIVQQQLSGDQNDDELNKAISNNESTNNDEGDPRPTVALLLSGGVDSSVALRLLQQEGFDVTAYYLKIWLEDEMAHLGECPWEDDVHICQEVCDQAGVPLKIISLQEEYHQRVMQHTLDEAAQGRTPNPDILCNSRVKFGCFLEYLGEDSFDYIASGHYAQLNRTKQSIEGDDSNNDESNGPVRLVRAPDPVKDQSYFLCALSQKQLKKLLFPIGHLQKSEVRELADQFDLPNRKRPDSQGLCFLGKVKFRDFLEIHLGKQQGDIIDAFSGEAIGRHDGVWYHTVGQRKGIGNSLFPLATAKGPWYVVAKDPSNNIVYASNQYDEDVFTQARSEFHVENIHWITGEAPAIINDNEAEIRFPMKIRHGPRLVQGTLSLLPEENNDGGIIKLDEKDGGLAPGQYVVFYNDEAECLGGGIISERHWAKFLLDAKTRGLEEAATTT